MPVKPDYLLDASVLAKWFVQEEDSEKAIKIRELLTWGKIRVSTISLARYELGNIFWKHPSKTLDTARKDFEAFSEMEIPTKDIQDTDMLTLIFETARKLGITFYDASYVEEAKSSNATLITADHTLYKKTKNYGNIECLRDWTFHIARKKRSMHRI
jgi:predicted nucleic acid-binding protein